MRLSHDPRSAIRVASVSSRARPSPTPRVSRDTAQSRLGCCLIACSTEPQTLSQFVECIRRQDVEIFRSWFLSQSEIGCYRHEGVVILRAAVFVVYLAHRCNRDERSNAKHQRGDYGNPYTHPDAHSGKAMSLGARRAPINSARSHGETCIRCGRLHGIETNGYAGIDALSDSVVYRWI